MIDCQFVHGAVVPAALAHARLRAASLPADDGFVRQPTAGGWVSARSMRAGTDDAKVLPAPCTPRGD